MANKTNCTINGQGYYRIRAKIGSNERGKPIMKPFYGTGKKDAEIQRDTYLDSIKAGLDMDLAKLTVASAMKSWLFEVKRVDNDLKASSFERYECIFRKAIDGSDLAAMLVPAVKSIHIQRLLNSLAEKGSTHSQMKNTLKVVKMFFIYATEEGYTLKNPCPKSITIPGTKPKKYEIETFTMPEVEKIKKCLSGNRLRFLILLALGTGMRKGEILAIKYSDIRDSKIHIHSSLTIPTVVDRAGKRTRAMVVGEPKSDASTRVIPFPKELIKELKAHRARQLVERMAIGLGGESEYIFTTETGHLCDPKNIYTAYGRLLKKAGVPDRKFHALRHTYATVLVRSGIVPLSVVQKLLGHEKIETTMIYVHTNMEDMTDAVKVLNVLLK